MKRKGKVLAIILGSVFVIGIVGSFCSAETVTLQIPSGAKIKYVYYKSAANGKRPVVLLLPGLSGLRERYLTEKYESLSKLLNKKYNFNVLMVDYRGKTNEEVFKIVREQSSKTFVEQEVARALDYLRKQENVDGEKIGVVGFSLGTVIAIRTAAREDCVKALALVSLITGPDVDLEPDFLRCSDRPMLFLAAKDDYIPQNKTNAAENSVYWSQQAKGNTKLEIVKGKMHSAELLETRGLQEMIGEWLKANLIEK